MGNAQLARPAQFDRPSQHRRSMIAKINVARHQLEGLDEDSYRQLLFEQTGKMSLKDCSEPQLAKVIDALKRKGFQPLPRPAARGMAMHPMARKARALWISLHHLGVVHNPGEPALEAFAKRQLGCDKLVWAKQSDGFRLIEALKDMAVRNGWRQVNSAGQPLPVIGLQETLCLAIVDKLKEAKAIPDDWTLNTAAMRICGIDVVCAAPVTAEQYSALAAALGAKLREAKGAVR